MKKEYTVAWVAWAIIAFLPELVLREQLGWTRIFAFVLFVLLEAAALYREKTGDTLSEHVWAFYAGKPARIPLILAVVAWVFIAILEIAGGVTIAIAGIPAAPMFLAAGVAVWLVPHFLGRGYFG